MQYLLTQRRKRWLGNFLLQTLVFVPAALFAQHHNKKDAFPVFEVSPVFSGIAGTGIGGNVGVGGRLTYTFSHDYPGSELPGVIALDGELNWLPVNKTPGLFNGGRALEGLFGAHIGIGDLQDRLALRLGSGFVRSDRVIRGVSSTGTADRITRFTNPVIHFGLLYERYRRESHWGMRFDAGDVIVIYPDVVGTTTFKGRNNFQASAALVYRFPMPEKEKRQ